jgi:hypothetical protein
MDTSNAYDELSDSKRQYRKRYNPEGGYDKYDAYIKKPKVQDFASTSRPSVDSLAQGVANLDFSAADNYKGSYSQASRLPTASITATKSSAYATYTDPSSTGYTDSTYTPTQQYESKITTSGPAGYGLSSAITSDPARQDSVDISQEPNSRYVAGTPQRGDTEKLDKSYVIRNRDYKTWFKIGRVFNTLWTDGLGGDSSKIDPTFVSEVIYGGRIHAKIRRFVVIRQSATLISCLPVTSYDGAGHLKRGINLEEHGFIYSRNKPERVPGMLQKALKVKLSKGGAPLKDPSLVHYGKVYTVETNVKVKDVGILDEASEEVLLYNFHKVFDDIDGTLQQPDLTPKAREADLAHVGGATSSYQTSPQPGPYLPSAISNVSSYPEIGGYSNHTRSEDSTSPNNYGTNVYSTGNMLSRFEYQPSTSNPIDSFSPIYNTTASTFARARINQFNLSLQDHVSQSSNTTYPQDINFAYNSTSRVTASAAVSQLPISQTSDTQILNPVSEPLNGYPPLSAAPVFNAAPGKRNIGETSGGHHQSAYSQPLGSSTDPATKDFPAETMANQKLHLKSSPVTSLVSDLLPVSGVGSKLNFPSAERVLFSNRQVMPLRLSRSSSQDSINSRFSTFSSQSSASSVTVSTDIRERIILLLSGDAQLKFIFEEAAFSVSLDSFEKELRRCLKQFSVNLKSEVTEPLVNRAAKVVRKHARGTAHALRIKLEKMSDGNRSKAHLSDADDDQLDEHNQESDNDLSGGEEQQIPDLEGIMTSTNSFQHLRDSVSLLVYPDERRKALLESWPLSKPRAEPVELVYHLLWELPNFVKSCFQNRQKIGDILTLTGDRFNAQASSCRDYIISSWPVVGEVLLKGLEAMMEANNREPGES